MKIAFIHPDLGIGGAERLVVDAAMGLQDLKNDITIYTSHCDKSHCFEEVSSDQLKVTVYGDFLPTQIMGKFHILFAILRQLVLVVMLIFTGEAYEYDYFVIDQLSFCIPILCIFTKGKILFYCHFPDQLLSIPSGIIKKLYRIPFNAVEEYTTGLSDKLIVNSNFTKSIFHKTFTSIKTVPDVIYPCVDIDQGIIETKEDEDADKEVKEFMKGNEFFISINRFERKKNIELAIKSYGKFKAFLEANGEPVPKLVVAGGFDSRVPENVQYLQELETLADSLSLKHFTIRSKLIIMPPTADILFLPSIKSLIKKALIKQSNLLFYTPSNEHFGIVPVESMLFKTPVIAPNNGGPLESISNYTTNKSMATGFNVNPTEEDWFQTLKQFHSLSDKEKATLGENGFKLVLKKFSRQQMAQEFWNNLQQASYSDKGIIVSILRKVSWLTVLGFSIILVGLVWQFK